jgi:signal peptidase I
VSLLACGSCGDDSDRADPAPERIEFTIRAGNMEPRLLINHRVEFDPGAYADRAPGVGDIVMIRPPRGAISGGCGRPRSPRLNELCVEPRGGPAREPIRFVTRVVAVGGDRIRFRRGRAIVNGSREMRRVIACPRGLDGCTFRRAITVPAGHVYVAGDNRMASDDSRFWGAVPEDQVVAKFVRVVR